MLRAHAVVVVIAAALASQLEWSVQSERAQGLSLFQSLTSSNLKTFEHSCSSATLNLVVEPLVPGFGSKVESESPKCTSVLAACDARRPTRYDQRHVYEELRLWESTNCYNPLHLNNSRNVNRSQTAFKRPRVGVLEELIAVIVIFGECITLGACFVNWVVVQMPGFAIYAVHNFVGLLVGGITAAAHHLLFTGWYLQWFPQSNIFLLAPMLQIVLSFSTGVLYASAMQHLAELHYQRRRLVLLSRYPPPARSH